MKRRQSRASAISLPLQLSALFLFAVSVVAALWQRGQVALVFGILLAVFPLGLVSRLPHRWFPGWLRQIAQLVLAGGGLAWWWLRIGNNPVDVVLVETAAFFGLALCIGGVLREYWMMLLISLVLLGFGGLMPGRQLYVPALALYVFVGILVMYQTRTMNLARVERSRVRLASSVSLSNWGYRLAHLLLAGLFLLLLLVWFPMPAGRSIGLIPVGFRTAQRLEFPMLWREWLNPTVDFFGDEQMEAEFMADMTDPENGTPMQAEDAAASVAAEEPSPSMDARAGNGGSGIGTDLVMRVQAPAKLYWLAQLYDVYDGKTWRVSPTLRRNRSQLDRHGRARFRIVEQVISVEKNVSRRLPAAYRVAGVNWAESMGWERSSPIPAMLMKDIAGVQIAGKIPKTPWRYQVRSRVPTLDSEKEMPSQQQTERPNRAYRRVASRLVSARLRRLAMEITEDKDGPMQKALALQDHLRTQYEYTLEAPAIPPDREPVDYFLFESRQGYCQHFAQAFTVLARLSGLPSRLATGYSPGTYNALAGTFDVYEYHAHAWTQVFIEPYGWLTFDGSPPGELRLESSPRFLQRLLDPFGEEWGAYPPELTLAQQLSSQSAKSPRRSPGEPRTSAGELAERIYSRAALDSRHMEPDGSAMARAAADIFKEWLGGHWERLKTGLGQWLDHVAQQAREALASTVAFVRDLSAVAYVLVGGVVLGLFLAWRRRRELWNRLRRAYARWRVEQRFRKLAALRGHASPSAIVAAAFETLRHTLQLGHYVQPTTMDLDEYAERLRDQQQELGRACGVIAGVASAQAFSRHAATAEQADRVCDALETIRKEILGNARRGNRPGGR